MKVRDVILALAIALLAFTASSFADGKLAIKPGQATLATTGSPNNVTINGFCSKDPCKLKWYVLLSASEVGSIDLTHGALTHFQAGKTPGTAIVVLQDEKGNMEFSTITVIDGK